MEKTKQATEQYCRYYIMNECLFGQEYAQIKEMAEEMNVSLNVDFNNCYLLLTGIEKRFYASRLNMRRKQYFQISNALNTYLTQQQKTYEFQFEQVTVNYDSSKLFVVVFTFQNPPSSFEKLGRSITKFTQQQFERYGLKEIPYLRNRSIISSHISSFNEFQKVFERMLKQHRLGFFSMEIPVEYEQQPLKNHKPLRFDQNLEQLEKALSANESKQVELLFNSMVNQLKKERRIVACYEMLVGIRRILFSLNELYSLNLEDQIEKIVNAQRYCSIEEMQEQCLYLMRKFMISSGQKSESINPLTMKAIQYLKKHVAETIGLNEVAYYLQVTPSYLSRLFNKELGISIPTYMNNLRMEQAKKRLVDSSLRIGEIAEMIGFSNPQYFCIQFKKATGYRPQEYRRMYQLEENSEPLNTE